MCFIVQQIHDASFLGITTTAL